MAYKTIRIKDPSGNIIELYYQNGLNLLPGIQSRYIGYSGITFFLLLIGFLWFCTHTKKQLQLSLLN